MKKTYILFFCLFLTSKIAYSLSVDDLNNSRYINLQCSYDFARDKVFKKYVKEQLDAFITLNEYESYRNMKEYYRKYRWWEFWKKRFVLFSIDQVSGTVHGGYRQDKNGMLAFDFGPTSTTYSIDPTYLHIETKVRGKVTDSFHIDRFSGQLFAEKYSVSLTEEKGEFEYFRAGKCTSVNKAF